ncbi:MAG: hypothetical protein WAV98_03550 [Minisyncoccia bacterium]
MSKKNITIVISIVTIIVIFVIFKSYYRPGWEVLKIARDGEMNGQTVQTVVAERAVMDFQFSPVMNGLTTFIADLPASANVLSLHVKLGEVFEGKDDATPGLQVLIQNDDGTACAMDINNVANEIQLLSMGKLCAIGQKAKLLIRDSSAMSSFSNGNITVLLSFVTF